MKSFAPFPILMITLCGILLAQSPLTHAVSMLRKDSHKLKVITTQINRLQQNIGHARLKQKTLQNQLKQTEITIGSVSRKIQQTKSQLHSVQHQLSITQNKQQTYQQQLDQQKDLLIKQLQSAYMFGRQPKIKILLNQENPYDTNRYFQYYTYFNQARLRAMHIIKILVARIQKTTDLIQQQKNNYQHMQNQLSSQKDSFIQQQTKRQHILKNTNQDIQSKQAQLQKLIEDKAALLHIVTEINAEKQYTYVPGKTFHQMRGKLHWPILSGKILQPFGTPIAGGRMHSTGLLIAAKPNTKVHAIFPGKVVYANWLRGFGLLTIIQHGKNYMTLYGRNESLYVKTGETVQAGQVIATAGNSGGFKQTALYFEVRYHGKPENPSIWLGRLT